MIVVTPDNNKDKEKREKRSTGFRLELSYRTSVGAAQN